MVDLDQSFSTEVVDFDQTVIRKIKQLMPDTKINSYPPPSSMCADVLFDQTSAFMRTEGRQRMEV